MAKEIAIMTHMRTSASTNPFSPDSSAYLKWRIALALLRFGLGAVFFWAGVPKVLNPIGFLAEIHQYGLVGPRIAVLAAVALPWLEFLVATCLISNFAVRGALAASSIILACYLVVQCIALHRGLQIDCGCGFSRQSEIVGPVTIGRNATLLAASLVAYCIAIFVHSGSSKVVKELPNS